MDMDSTPTAAMDATRELRLALRNLDDPVQLSKSPLARLSFVRARALGSFGGQAHAEGLALRDLLIQTIVRVDQNLKLDNSRDSDEIRRMRCALRGLARGESIASVARSFGLDPTRHASRALYQVHNTLVRTFLESVGHMESRQLREYRFSLQAIA